MHKRKWMVAFCTLTIAAGLGFILPAAALDGYDCTGSPSDAVMTLPPPLSKWGQISCTPFGHMLSSHEGWVWIMPDASETVFVPSQLVDRDPEPLGNKSYFTKVEVAKVKGDEFDEAYATFHVGFDEKEVKPDAYRVDLTSVSGKTMRMFFFDYDSYAWGMSCPDNACSPNTRFMILDKAHRPAPRQPAI